jgi:hypothetical protein
VQDASTRDVSATGALPSHQDLKLTRALLACGAVAGPIYLIVGLAQAFTRPGFDLTRHSLSLLSNGDLGWIHITNLVITGLLVVAGAHGLRRALASGRGSAWAPLLLGIYGLSLIGAGFFVADPGFGFPPGTQADATIVTWRGIMHFVSGGIGFLALIAACFILAWCFASTQQRGWAMFSLLTGIVFFAAFIGIASGSGNPWTILGFWIGVVLAWIWLSLLSAKIRAGLDRPHRGEGYGQS